MIHNQAIKLAAGLANRKIIEGNSQEVYAYGLELIISALINIFIIAIISIIFHRYYDWALFLLAFIPLRTTAGGYHASTHFSCILVGTIAFSVSLALSHIQIDWRYIILAITGMSFLCILLYSPVEAQNKKLSDERVLRNRRTSIVLAVLNIGVAAIAFFISEFSAVMNIYFLGVFVAALSMLAVKAKNWRGGGKHEVGEEMVPETSVGNSGTGADCRNDVC